MSTAEHLGFRPSWSARALNSSDGGFIGIVMSDLYSAALAPIVVGAYRQLRESGHEVLLSTASLSQPGADRTLEEAQVAFIHDLRPSSLLIVGAVRDMRSLGPLAAQVPTVVAGSREVDLPVAAEVFTDDVAGMDDVITHLVGLGHRDIAHIAGIGRVGVARAAAYEKAMARHGLGAHTHVEWGDFEEHAGYRSTREFLASASPPTAITTAGDPAAAGALAAVREAGVDVAVVGYGNAPLAGYGLIQLTTVDPDNQKIGAAAASALLAARPGDDAARQIRIRPRLVVRSSAGRSRP
ncbi:HTH-type transcriptional repressor PurR [Acidipropionibacterium virtanenii]|uniref:HTH-type transcriptional repressor PurR n=2 Tax=Acidipropionibacterium virtanenii TaxID=2057246 RepID=A0A344UQY4_9ACTN|nr:HTH-type transcriptional repressor PurR [Acidipropionibacterium virtanenii]